MGGPKGCPSDELDEESENELLLKGPSALAAHDAWPSSWHEAMKQSDTVQWKAATQEEIEAHIANGTWTPCPLPPGKKAIGC